MQFHRTSTNPIPGALLVCRQVRWNLIVLLAVFWAAPLGMRYIDGPRWLIVVATVLPALLTWPLLSAWRKRGRPDNWVLAVHRRGLWLNLRDAEYHEAAPAETVAYLPYEEILSARRFIHRYTTPGSDGGSTSHRDVYLELRLSAEHAAELKAAIAAERGRDLPERRYLGGLVTARSRRVHSPVEVEAHDAVRIKFTTASNSLRPSIKRALAALAEFMNVMPDEKPIALDWQNLQGPEFDEAIRRLVINGQKFDALELLRRRRGMTTTEAHHFIEELKASTATTDSPEPLLSF
jgi:hypothetical protein